MGNGFLHQPDTAGRGSAIFARSESRVTVGKKVNGARGQLICASATYFMVVSEALSFRQLLLYSIVWRGTQVAEGRGLQNPSYESVLRGINRLERRDSG